MIKASEGGGGKGIRMVKSLDGVESAYIQCCAECPGSPIFLMQLATGCRHLEVQLLADKHGGVTSLKTRDCSVQRRCRAPRDRGGGGEAAWRGCHGACLSRRAFRDRWGGGVHAHGNAARQVVDDLGVEGGWAATTVKRHPQRHAQPPVRQPHPATFSTAPVHQPLGSANAETTPAGAPAAAADRKQPPDATCGGKNG